MYLNCYDKEPEFTLNFAFSHWKITTIFFNITTVIIKKYPNLIVAIQQLSMMLRYILLFTGNRHGQTH